MQDFFKNIFYFGAGAAFMTKEKMEELKNEFIERGKMTQDEGKKFIDEWVRRSEEAKADIEKRIQEVVRERMEKMNIAAGMISRICSPRLKCCEQLLSSCRRPVLKNLPEIFYVQHHKNKRHGAHLQAS